MSDIFDELRLTCRRLTLNRYHKEAAIGALTKEHGRTQPVILTIDVWVGNTLKNDRLNAVYDYRLLPAAADTVIAAGHIELQETLVERIAQTLLADDRVRAVRVYSVKPEAYENCDGIGVEIFRLARPGKTL